MKYEFLTESQKQLQAAFDSRKLADRVEAAIVTDQIVPELHQRFIASREEYGCKLAAGES